MQTGPTLPTLETERLRLRAVTPADAGALYRIFSDPLVTRYWGSPRLTDPAQGLALVEEIQRGARTGALLQWGVTRTGEDRVIGTCTLAGWDRQHRRAELGFALGRSHWGRGVMAEALPTVLRFGFVGMQLHRIEADVDPRNAPSVRHLERLGFRREGLLRERYHQGGEVQDALFYGLLRAEWEQAHPGVQRLPAV